MPDLQVPSPLLVDEGALPAHPTVSFEATDVLHIARLPRRQQRTATALALGVVDVDVPVPTVHGLLHEGLVDAPVAHDDIVLGLLHRRVRHIGAAVPCALHEERRRKPVLLERKEL